MSRELVTTREVAEAALRGELEAVDSPRGAAQALARVVRRVDLPAETTWDAFRLSAEKALDPFFDGEAKPTVWVVMDIARRNGASPGMDIAGGPAAPSLLSLAEVLADPKALDPPEVVVPHFAWKGRVTLFAAREKLGKSTTARAGCAAVTAGRHFLGQVPTSGRVLYVALEEHLSDVARGFQEFGTDPERTFLLDRVEDPFGQLEAAVREVEPVIVVVDTLAAFTESLGLDPGSSSDWTPVMARFTRLARDEGVALELLHHGTKRDGGYRDSTAIGAGVDAILEMSEGTESSLRTVKARARWRLEDFGLRMVNAEHGPRFELASGELSLDARVLMYLERDPGASSKAVRDNVTGKASDIDATLQRLAAAGSVVNQGGPRGHRWHLTRASSLDDHPSSPENPQGQATDEELGQGGSSQSETIGPRAGTTPAVNPGPEEAAPAKGRLL